MVEDEERKWGGRVICAWCGKDMGPSPTPEDSHGICPECGRRLLEQARREREAELQRRRK